MYKKHTRNIDEIDRERKDLKKLYVKENKNFEFIRSCF